MPRSRCSLIFFFLIKAKYLAAIYVLFYVAVVLVSGERFLALTALCNAGVGYVFLMVAPRRGFRVGLVREVVCAAEFVLSGEAAARGEEVHRVYAQAGQGREPG